MPDSTIEPLDVAIGQVAALLLKFCVPLYQYDQNHRPSLNGTGFFVKLGDHTFLVSAAHVLDTTASPD